MRRAMYSMVLLACLAGMLTGCRRYSGLCDIGVDPDPCCAKSLFYAGVNANGGGCGEGGCFNGGHAAGGCANGACGGASVETVAPAHLAPAPVPAKGPLKL
ncbi:MAG: hypothetical protein K2X38_15855 [Gemmataceae bacterium]|nr:hypothetical protein [Gemmataceae bacterium]